MGRPNRRVLTLGCARSAAPRDHSHRERHRFRAQRRTVRRQDACASRTKSVTTPHLKSIHSRNRYWRIHSAFADVVSRSAPRGRPVASSNFATVVSSKLEFRGGADLVLAAGVPSPLPMEGPAHEVEKQPVKSDTCTRWSRFSPARLPEPRLRSDGMIPMYHSNRARANRSRELASPGALVQQAEIGCMIRSKRRPHRSGARLDASGRWLPDRSGRSRS